MTPRKTEYTTARATGGMTYHEIAAVMGVSHTRVQQIEAEAMRKLRVQLHRDLIPDESRRVLDTSIYG